MLRLREGGVVRCGEWTEGALSALSPVACRGTQGLLFGYARRDVPASRFDEFRDHARKPIEDLLERHRWLHEVRGLFAQYLDQGIRIEVEEVAEEVILRLRVDALGQQGEGLEVPV